MAIAMVYSVVGFTYASNPIKPNGDPINDPKPNRKSINDLQPCGDAIADPKPN